MAFSHDAGSGYASCMTTAQLKERVRQLEEQQRRLEQELRRLEEELHKHKAQIDEQAARIRQLQQEKHKLQKENAELKKRLGTKAESKESRPPKEASNYSVGRYQRKRRKRRRRKKSPGRRPKEAKGHQATETIDVYWRGVPRRKCVLRREQFVWRLIDGKAVPRPLSDLGHAAFDGTAPDRRGSQRAV